MSAEQRTWPEFNGATAISFPRGNGLEHIFFGENAKNITPEAVLGGHCLELTRISHQITQGEERINGLYVNRDERGSGLASELVDWFIESAPYASAEFGGSNLIHKPGLATLLGKRGLFALDCDFEVAFTNRYKDDTGSDTPSVIIVRDSLDDFDRRRRVKRTNASGKREFYTVVGGPGWGERPSGAMPRTHLHTRFIP